MVAVQQHFSRVKALEYQIEVSEQARLSLEMQIQANNRKNLDLEQWLRQREEDLRSLQQLNGDRVSATMQIQDKANQFSLPSDQLTNTTQQNNQDRLKHSQMQIKNWLPRSILLRLNSRN